MAALSHVSGLRIFLLVTLHLVSEGKKESCQFVKDNIQEGIATALYRKYEKEYSSFDVKDNLKSIDEYYQQWAGNTDEAYSKYFCDEEDGLSLVIAFALNDLF